MESQKTTKSSSAQSKMISVFAKALRKASLSVTKADYTEKEQLRTRVKALEDEKKLTALQIQSLEKTVADLQKEVKAQSIAMPVLTDLPDRTDKLERLTSSYTFALPNIQTRLKRCEDTFNEIECIPSDPDYMEKDAKQVMTNIRAAITRTRTMQPGERASDAEEAKKICKNHWFDAFSTRDEPQPYRHILHYVKDHVDGTEFECKGKVDIRGDGNFFEIIPSGKMAGTEILLGNFQHPEPSPYSDEELLEYNVVRQEKEGGGREWFLCFPRKGPITITIPE